MKIDHISEEIVNSIHIPIEYLYYRRILEILLIILSLPVVIILAIITTILVYLDIRRNLYFIQDRSGYMGVKFKLYKFRTMKNGTGSKLGESEISIIGRFLRKHRLDELPQLINIIKGDMSLIGPRPEPYNHYLECKDKIPYFDSRLKVRPGLTGWAQVRYRHTSDIDGAHEKLRYDLYYIKNISFKIDFQIFLHTLRVLLTGSGAK